jgi:hypothetical protein
VQAGGTQIGTVDIDDPGPAPILQFPDEGVIILLRNKPVMLDSRVAIAFGTETRAINQTVTRHREKFTSEHCFQLDEKERDFLTSQGVIPKPGRGGSRSLPFVYTQKGVVRLATILNSPQARDATDRMIDLFIEIHQQLALGRGEVSISQPQRILPSSEITGQAKNIRTRLLEAIGDLLVTRINPNSKATVADEIADVAGGALNYVKAHLNAKGLDNEKVAAETILILEKAREVRDRTRADLDKSAAETERIHLENFEKRLTLAERVWTMAEKFEPNEIVSLNQAFVKPSLFLRGPSAGPARNLNPAEN